MKDETSHTPGPWVGFGPWSNEGGFSIMPAMREGEIAVVPPHNSNASADAYLIAAAPDLYEVVAELIEARDCQPGYVRELTLMKARAAIAKAVPHPLRDDFRGEENG